MDIQKIYQYWKASAGITTDTRKILKNQMFFAIKGENFDGNTFALKALELEAAYVVVDDISFKEHQDHRIIWVSNVLQCLQELASYHRDQLNIPVIGITGSNGKTTTKELTRDVLAMKYMVLATQGNLNNHIGVPLTVLSVTADIELAIVEMGANHIGEIDLLCRIAKPDYCMITNIGRAHLEGFGGIDGIMQGKSEMYRYIAANAGKIFINTEDDVLVSLIPTGANIQAYKPSELLRICEDEETIIYESSGRRYQTHMYGAYNVSNIAFAMAVGQYFGVPTEHIHQAITAYKPGNNRSQLFEYQGNRVVLDAYNANPSSMKASIESFVRLGGEQVIILGDMFELGEYSEEEHKVVLALVEKYTFTDKIFIGEAFLSVSDGHSGHFFKDIDAAKKYFKQCNFKDKNILLKGSRGIAVERILG